MTDWGHVVEIF